MQYYGCPCLVWKFISYIISAVECINLQVFSHFVLKSILFDVVRTDVWCHWVINLLSDWWTVIMHWDSRFYWFFHPLTLKVGYHQMGNAYKMNDMNRSRHKIKLKTMDETIKGRNFDSATRKQFTYFILTPSTPALTFKYRAF